MERLILLLFVLFSANLILAQQDGKLIDKNPFYQHPGNQRPQDIQAPKDSMYMLVSYYNLSPEGKRQNGTIGQPVWIHKDSLIAKGFFDGSGGGGGNFKTLYIEGDFGQDVTLSQDTVLEYDQIILHVKPLAADDVFVSLPDIPDTDEYKGKSIFIYSDGGEVGATTIVDASGNSVVNQVDCRYMGRYTFADTLTTERNAPELGIYRTVFEDDYTKECQYVTELQEVNDTIDVRPNIGRIAYLSDTDEFLYYDKNKYWKRLDQSAEAYADSVAGAAQNAAQNYADGLAFSAGSFTSRDTTVTSDFAASTANRWSITSFCISGVDNTISLPEPADSIRGNVIEVTHFDTSASRSRATTVQTNFTDFDIYNNLTGDTLNFFNISQDRETAVFTLSEIEGVLRWVYTPKYRTRIIIAVDSIQQIPNLNVKLGDRIKVKSTGAEYLVQADSITGYSVDQIAVIFNGGNYVVLESETIYPEFFGGGINKTGDQNDEAFQKTVNFAITKGSSIKTRPGRYTFLKGFLIGQKYKTGEYNFTSLKISGHTPAYGTPSIFKNVTEFFSASDTSFIVAIQQGRKVRIENISFLSNISAPNTPKQTVEFDDLDWTANGKSGGRYTPHCAIAIDPFFSTTPTKYPGWEGYYTNTNIGGSSMIQIEGCSFQLFYHAIAHNPSGSIANGDNVMIKQCNVSRCRTFLASGQTQARGNVIDDLYSTGRINTLVDCISIGSQAGTAPVILNSNLAGSHKMIFNVQNGFSGVRLTNTYMESVFSLGISSGMPATFINCRIKLMIYEAENVFAPPYILKTTVASFKGGSLEYFSNCSYQYPFVISSENISAEGMLIEGGLIVDRYSNSPGEDLFTVHYENVRHKCYNEVFSESPVFSGANQNNIKGKIAFPGKKIYTSSGTTRTEYSPTGLKYSVIPMGTYNIQIDSANYRAFFYAGAANSYKFRVNESLATNTNIPTDLIFPNQADYRATLGFVESISNDTVYVNCPPYGFPEGNSFIYSVSPFRIYEPVFGNTTAGNDTIKNVSKMGSQFEVGDRIYSSNTAIPVGAQIAAITTNEIIMNVAATGSSSNIRLQGREYHKTIKDRNIPTTGGYDVGDIVINDRQVATLANIDMWFCSSGGVFGQEKEPTFTPVDFSDYNENINTLQTQAQQFESNYTFTSFPYTGLDTIPVDTLLSQRFVVTGALDSKTITGIEYTLDSQVTTRSTLVRLLKYTPSTNTYTPFGSASITIGNSFATNTPSQSINQGDIIYCETTQTGDNVTGLTVTLKIE